MPGLDLARLVLIRSNVPDADRSLRMGTGYFVTDDLVLTANHVVDMKSTKIEVRPEQNPGWKPADAVIWRNVTLDAALIRVRHGLTMERPPVSWAESVPDGNVEWTTTAYPHADTEH